MYCFRERKELSKKLFNESLYDVYYVIGGKKIGAVKAVLAANSDYFKSSLIDYAKSGTNEIELNDGFSAESFQFIVNFCFDQQLSLQGLSSKELLDLIKAADKYLVTELIEGIKLYFLGSDGNFLTPRNIIFWANEAEKTQLKWFCDVIEELLNKWYRAYQRYEGTSRVPLSSRSSRYSHSSPEVKIGDSNAEESDAESANDEITSIHSDKS